MSDVFKDSMYNNFPEPHKQIMELGEQVKGKGNEIDILNTLSVNVKSFKAVGDGVKDDTEAFLRAIKEINKFFLNNNYVCSAELFIPAGVYKLNGKLVLSTLAGQSTSASTNRSQLAIRGASMFSTKLMFDSGGFDISGLGITMTDMFMQTKGTDPVLLLGKKTLRDANGFSSALNTSVFSRLKVTGNPKAVEVQYMYDSSFYDCQFGSIGVNNNANNSSAVFDIVNHDEDMSNFLRFYSCRFEWSEAYSTLFRATGSVTSGYHHNITLNGCHFETHNFSTSSFELVGVRTTAFNNCSFMNNSSSGTDTLLEKPNLIQNVQGVTFNGCRFNGSRDIKNAPYLKLVGEVYNLEMANTTMYGQSVYNIENYIDTSGVSNYATSSATWRLSINRGAEGSTKYNSPLRTISTKDNNKRFEERVEPINAKNWVVNRFDSGTSGSAFDSNSTNYFSYDEAGKIKSQGVSSTLQKTITAAGQYVFNFTAENTNKRGMYIIMSDNPTSTYALVFSNGVSLVSLFNSPNVIVTDALPGTLTSNSAHVYLSSKNIAVTNNLGSDRNFMVFPISF